MKNKLNIHIPARPALWILRLGLPIIVIEGIAILISYLNDRKADVLLANDLWSTALSDFLTAVIVAVGLAFFADAIDADIQKRKR
ncbi:MAG: hypothetical protein J5885_01600 [Clostridia bacterium]|nr:hypothetical protein [Clostridia bacterium]